MKHINVTTSTYNVAEFNNKSPQFYLADLARTVNYEMRGSGRHMSYEEERALFIDIAKNVPIIFAELDYKNNFTVSRKIKLYPARTTSHFYNESKNPNIKDLDLDFTDKSSAFLRYEEFTKYVDNIYNVFEFEENISKTYKKFLKKKNLFTIKKEERDNSEHIKVFLNKIIDMTGVGVEFIIYPSTRKNRMHLAFDIGSKGSVNVGKHGFYDIHTNNIYNIIYNIHESMDKGIIECNASLVDKYERLIIKQLSLYGKYKYFETYTVPEGYYEA